MAKAIISSGGGKRVEHHVGTTLVDYFDKNVVIITEKPRTLRSLLCKRKEQHLQIISEREDGLDLLYRNSEVEGWKKSPRKVGSVMLRTKLGDPNFGPPLHVAETTRINNFPRANYKPATALRCKAAF